MGLEVGGPGSCGSGLRMGESGGKSPQGRILGDTQGEAGLGTEMCGGQKQEPEAWAEMARVEGAQPSPGQPCVMGRSRNPKHGQRWPGWRGPAQPGAACPPH